MSSALISPSTSFGKMQPKKKHLNNKARITQIGSLGFEPACGGVMKGSGSCSHCAGRVRWRRRIRVALSNADGNVHLSFVSQSLGRPGHRGNPARRALPSPACRLPNLRRGSKALTLIGFASILFLAVFIRPSDKHCFVPQEDRRGGEISSSPSQLLSRSGYFHFLLVVR